MVDGMRGPHLLRRSTALLLTAAMVAACSGGDEPASDDASESATSGVPSEPAATPGTDDDATGGTEVSGPTTLPAPPTTLPRETFQTIAVDPDTGEVTEIDEPEPGPTTHAEVVDAGVEAGIWDEVDGITRVLEYVLGVLPAEQVPGVAEVQSDELAEVLERAWQMNASGDYSDDELEPLRQRYEFFSPPIERLAAEASPGSLAQGFRSQAAAPACAPIEVANFNEDAWITGCYIVLEQQLPDATLRVFYPNWYEEDAELASLAGVTLNAMVHSVERFRELGRVGDMDVVFSAVDTAENYDEESEGYTLASAWGVKPWDNDVVDTCAITTFPVATGDVTAYEQTIAHEVWHCVQFYDGMNYSGGQQNWWVEGGAEFFSNVAYPSANDEWGRLSTFDAGQRFPLYEMDYEVWPWWQHLSNEFSPLFVADLHREMMQSGGSGIELLDGYDETFHDFVADYAAGVIQDQSGAPLPAARRYKFLPVVGKNDEGKELTYDARSWAPIRLYLQYDQELRIFQTDASDGGLRSMVEWEKRRDRPSWEGVFPEVRSKCQDRARYAAVITDVTSDASTSVKFKVVIDDIEEAACDPCMLGTWSLNLDTFEAMILGAAAGEGVGLPPGASFEFGGAYYFSMDDEDVVLEQRDNLQIIMAVAGIGGLTMTVDSFASGTYSADGETLTVNNLNETYNQVTADTPLGGTFSFPSAIAEASGEYECGEDTMTLTVANYPPVSWTRVDKILQPPDAPTDPGTGQPND